MQHTCDIVVIGAGPAGLSFAAAAAPSGLNILLIEQSSQETLANPPYDGREIALTHPSRGIMEKLGLWQHIPAEGIYPLKAAKVINGSSPYTLNFPPPTDGKGQLGFLVSNHDIRRAAYQAASQHENVHFLTGHKVQEAVNGEESVSILLDNGDTVSARLLIAADSRFSQTRRQAGTSADMHDFGRTVLVARFSHTTSNENTAYECFSYGRTIALLPLGEHMTNCVITIDNRRLHEITELSPEALAADLEQHLQGQLGKMTPAGSIHTYPLVGVHARRFSARRTALIGDAAVGMHPVTAHGFNLGLASADILAGLIVQAAASDQDIADTKLLEKYEAKHILHTRALYHGTNFVVKLFTNETPPAKFLRNTVLRLSNHLPPVKKLITKQLTG